MGPRKQAPPPAKAPKAEIISIESLRSSGVDVEVVRASLAKLAGSFPGGIPDLALARWVDQHFPSSTMRGFFMLVGREWEKSCQ